MKIIGAMVAGSNEKRMPEVLDRMINICDEIWVCCNNWQEYQIVDLKSLEKIQIVRDNREWGKFQDKIKQDFFDNYLKKRLQKDDWILWLDADEVLDESFTRQEAEKLASKKALGYNFYFVNLIDDGYSKKQSFWNIRFWRYDPDQNNVWQRRNLHCGNYPYYIAKQPSFAPFVIKHYGLKDKEDRQKKIDRYKKYDPNGHWMRMNNTYYKRYRQLQSLKLKLICSIFRV